MLILVTEIHIYITKLKQIRRFDLSVRNPIQSDVSTGQLHILINICNCEVKKSPSFQTSFQSELVSYYLYDMNQSASISGINKIAAKIADAEWVTFNTHQQ